MYKQKDLEKAGHRQAMYTAGLILRWIEGPCELNETIQDIVRDLFRRPVEQFDKDKIEEVQHLLLDLVDEALVDYYEDVIQFKSLTQTIRITKAFYDVLNGMDLMRGGNKDAQV